MSADNTIVILKTPSPDGFEFRVTHAQAIDNIYWDETAPDNYNPNGNPKEVVNYFGKCNVFTNSIDALKFAQEKADKILSDDFCPILEYGISQIILLNPFSYYVEKANKGK
jgi:hypothetical protein